MRRSEGLDWDAIRAAHDARAQAEAPTPPPDPPRVSEQRSKPRTRPSTSRPGSRRPPVQLPKFDPEEVRRLYADLGLSARQVAARLGAHPSTISRRVRILGVARTEDMGKKGGPAPKDRCVRNHEFTPENTRHLKGGGRSCRACERIRGREHKARSRAAQNAKAAR